MGMEGCRHQHRLYQARPRPWENGHIEELAIARLRISTELLDRRGIFYSLREAQTSIESSGGVHYNRYQAASRPRWSMPPRGGTWARACSAQAESMGFDGIHGAFWIGDLTGIDSPFGRGKMPAAYSADIRGRVIARVESGSSRREAADQFEVSPSSAIDGFLPIGRLCCAPSREAGARRRWYYHGLFAGAD